MKQILNSKTDPLFPNIELNFPKEVELFIDSFYGLDVNKNSFKILYVKEMEAISKFRAEAIKHHKLFDAIITYDEEILNRCPNSHFLEFGTTWIFDYEFKEKKHQISHLTGHKTMTEGHLLRQKVHYKQNKIKTLKDFYISKHGGVENVFNNKILYDKKEPLFDSQFHICIENSQQNNCFTEKLIDFFVTKTIPIYWGCPNIDKFFYTNGMFIVNSFDEIMSVCNSLNENTYLEKIDFINKNLALSQKYTNIVNRLDSIINKILNPMEKSKEPKSISVVIPTYEMHGVGVEFLGFSFDKLKEQSFLDFDIVVSDHSTNDYIQDLCKKYSTSLDIKYYRNHQNLGNSSANVNNAIRLATGKIIKILFQDDFLYSKDSLKNIKESFDANPDKKWLVSACEHSTDGINFYRTFIPNLDTVKLISGVNTISSPSVVSFLSKYNVQFDENLIWMMDCDYYVRMANEFGEPIILESVNIANRIWSKQYNNMIPVDTKEKEKEYIKNKFNK